MLSIYLCFYSSERLDMSTSSSYCLNTMSWQGYTAGGQKTCQCFKQLPISWGSLYCQSALTQPQNPDSLPAPRNPNLISCYQPLPLAFWYHALSLSPGVCLYFHSLSKGPTSTYIYKPLPPAWFNICLEQLNLPLDSTVWSQNSLPILILLSL